MTTKGCARMIVYSQRSTLGHFLDKKPAPAPILVHARVRTTLIALANSASDCKRHDGAISDVTITRFREGPSCINVRLARIRAAYDSRDRARRGDVQMRVTRYVHDLRPECRTEPDVGYRSCLRPRQTGLVNPRQQPSLALTLLL